MRSSKTQALRLARICGYMNLVAFYTSFVLILNIDRIGCLGMLYPLLAHDSPSLSQFNLPGRPMSDHVAVLDTRSLKPLKSRIKWLRVKNFSGNNGNGTLNLHGNDIREDPVSGKLQLLAINHRTPLDPITGVSLDLNLWEDPKRG